MWGELRRSLRSPEETKHRPFDGGQRLEVASAPARGRCTEERSKKIAPAPGRTVSPEENIQNVGRTPAKPPFTGGNDKWRVLPVAVTAVYNGTERL